MARLTTTQAQLRGPINRDENLVAHSWFTTLVVGAIIGAIALLVWMFQAGVASERRWPTTTGAIIPARSAPSSPAVPPAVNIHVDGEVRVAPATPELAPAELTPEELDRRHTAYLRSQQDQ